MDFTEAQKQQIALFLTVLCIILIILAMNINLAYNGVRIVSSQTVIDLYNITFIP